MPENQQWRRAISRRKALALTGAAGVGTIAGCLGDGNGNGDDGSGDDGSGDDGDSPEDVLGPELENQLENVDYNENYEEDWTEVVPAEDANPFDGEYTFNPYSTSWNGGDMQERAFEYLAVFHAEDGFIPRVADSWDHDQDNGVTTVTLSEDYSWSDGEPIMARDFVTTMKLSIYMNQPLSDYVNPDGVRETGEYEFEVHARDEYADMGEDLWLNQWVETLLNVNYAQYNDFIEQFEEADEDEYESIQQQVVDFNPAWDQVRYSGPFLYVDANEEYSDQVPNPGHPKAQDLEIYLRTGEYVEEEGLRSGNCDWGHQFPTLDDLPDKLSEAPVSYSGQSLAILFGPNDDYISSDPRVRQALAHAIDFEFIVEETSPGTPVDTYQSGIDFGYVEQFVSGDVLDAMTNYAPRDTDRATTLLEDAGFSLDDGTWYTPDDDEWELSFPTGDWFEDHGDIVSNNLSDFGVSNEWNSKAMTNWQADHEDPPDYDISIHLNYGLARQYHAHADLDEELFGDIRGAVNQTEILDNEVEVPEVGNPEGDTITINLEEQLDELSKASDEDTVMELSSNVAWAHNQLLPGAPIHPWSEHYWVNDGEFNFDVDSSAWVTSNRITHYIIEEGLAPR